MQTYLNGIPTEEVVIKLLQWPEDISFPIGFEVSGEESSESENDEDEEQEARRRRLAPKQTSSYIVSTSKF
jgi:hypothetical protein